MPNLLHPDLRRLTLTSTSISVLSSASFSSYRNLLHLNLSSNAIEGLRDMPFRFQTDLVTFSLRGNRLASLASLSLTGLASLQELDLSHNRLQELARGVFKPLLSLTTLRLEANLLTSLDYHTFAGLSPLLHLSLAANPLAEVREEVLDQVPSLTSLDLGHTSLTSLPSLRSLPGLVELQVEGNRLAGVEASLEGLARLEVLGLANSSLRALPALPTTNLLALNLSYNPLVAVAPEHLSLLPLLKVLDLSHLPGLTTLQTPSLTSLHHLHLSHCPLLYTWATSPLPSLTHLDLRHSSPSLPSPSLLPSLSSLQLEGRPWECTCSLHPWHLLLSSLPPSHRDSPTCTSGTPLLSSTFPSCSPLVGSPSLAVGLGLGLLLLLLLLGGLLFHQRARAAYLVRQVRGCGAREGQGVQYQRQFLQPEDYWLSLARRAQARPDPGTPVPVTEL